MIFETTEEALKWYEGEERVVTPEFIANIPWQEIKKHPISKSFLPVLKYMRDVETFTDMYYRQLLRTKTSKDVYLRQFMDRWSTEEPVHGELLNRFMEEADLNHDDENWKERAYASIPKMYHATSWLMTTASQVIGGHFSAVHMTWGAINEYSTMTGYKRLWQLADHPVLTQILHGIMREEARHSLFYWSVARIKLLNSPFRQKLSRTIINKFWAPVGSGTKPESETNAVIKALFEGEEGARVVSQHINDRIAALPGFKGLTTISDRIGKTILQVPI
jgi:rubrerythrin